MSDNLYTVTMTKGREGWEAKTEFSMGRAVDFNGKEGDRILRLSTGKASRGGIYSSAQVVLKTEMSECHMYGMGGPGDWSKSGAAIAGRVTEKSIRAAHHAALAGFPDMIEDARQWYAQGKDKGV